MVVGTRIYLEAGQPEIVELIVDWKEPMRLSRMIRSEESGLLQSQMPWSESVWVSRYPKRE